MKKLLAFVMAAAMTLSLAACGGGSSSSAGTSTPAGTSSAPAASSTPADTADFKVGAIYINGQNDTAGYTFQHHSGITKAMENLGLDPASQLLIVDNVAEDYTPSPTPSTPWPARAPISSSASPSATSTP